jgi:ferric-dicitrate binding protein FerR (iron transport regulator)
MNPSDEPYDDDEIARLLRNAGERDRPDAVMQAEVREAVEVEWRELVSVQERRRRVITWAAAAGVALAALGIWLTAPRLGRGPQSVASLVLVTGTVEGRIDPEHDWKPIGSGTAIGAGQEIRTTDRSRAALVLASGLELRLDQASRLAFEPADEVALQEGAVYVDTGGAAGSRSDVFALRTASGTVHHLGTRYEARINGDELLVAIREGRVRIDTPGGVVSGDAGEQILVDDGRVSRRDRPAHDAAWDWVGEITPAYSIEGRTLAEFLSWAARETGRDLVFANAEAEREAARIVLRGSVDGLSPDESITAVGATTGLAIVVARGRIEVGPDAS